MNERRTRPVPRDTIFGGYQIRARSASDGTSARSAKWHICLEPISKSGGGRASALADEPPVAPRWSFWDRLLGKRALVCLLFVTSVCAAQVTNPSPDDDKKDNDGKKVGRRLIRKSTTGSDEDLMDKIIRLMEQTGRRLEIELDAGEQTQAMQEEVLTQLDDAIKLAASQTRKSSGRQSSSKSDQRRRDQQKKPGSKSGSEKEQDASKQSESNTTPAGEATDSGVGEGRDLAESRRGWGNLPERDRDEVIQGADEQFLERYRRWIEQYYRALQDAPE